MPDVSDQLDPATDPNQPQEPETITPREDILKLVGLSHEVAERLAQEESRDILRIRTARENGEKIYDQLKSGQEITVVNVGSGQFPISPIESPKEFVQEITARLKELKPPPPQDEIKELLKAFGGKALQDNPKDFETAVDCYSFAADLNLVAQTDLIEALKKAAASDHEKYDLAKALEGAIPAKEEPVQAPPENQVIAAAAPEAARPSAAPAQEIKKPYLPFGNFKPLAGVSQKQPPVAPTNGQTPQINIQQSSEGVNVQTPLSDEPVLRPVPQNPKLGLAQDLADAT